MQCQLSLFKGGYLKGRRDKACTQSRRYSVWPAGWSEKKKRRRRRRRGGGERERKSGRRRRRKKGKQPAEEKKQRGEKEGLTMPTEEAHNANSFPNTTDCFPHKEEKGAAFSPLHFNKQRPHKTSQPLVLFGHKKTPRRSKRSHCRTHKKKRREEGVFFTTPPRPSAFISLAREREKEREGRRDGGGGIVSELIISVFEKERGDL